MRNIQNKTKKRRGNEAVEVVGKRHNTAESYSQVLTSKVKDSNGELPNIPGGSKPGAAVLR